VVVVDDVVVELLVVELAAGVAAAAVGAIPTRATAARSATAPRYLSSILLDVGIDTPHLETGSAWLIGWAAV
jgi:hypothetical protein